MKRILALILTIATLLVLTACGASSSKESGEDSNVYSLGDTVSTDVMEFTLDMAEFAIAAHDGTAGDYNDICLPKEFDAERDDNASFVAALGHTLICYQFTIKNLDRVTLPIVESSLDVFVTAAYNGETYDCDNNGFYESADSYDWGCEGDFLSVEAQTTTHYRSTASIAVEAENFTDSFSLTFSLPTSSGETKDFTFEVTSADIEKQKQVKPTLDEAVEEDEVFDENIAVEEELDIIREASVGSVVPFGSYDHRLAWIVLEKDNGKALLVSKRVLDRKPYADNPQKATWEACSLREWLNDSFYNEAFSKKEQQCIVLSTLESQSDGQEGVTQDKVFILNMLEHQKYYDQIPNYGKVFATQYAAKFYSPDLIEWFWIRSSISDSYEDGNAKAMNANSNERLCTITQANLEYGGVRPVICVDLK